jgi:hypothetical protein
MPSSPKILKVVLFGFDCTASHSLVTSCLRFSLSNSMIVFRFRWTQAPHVAVFERDLHTLHLASCCESLYVPMSSYHRSYMQEYLIKRPCHSFDYIVQDQNFTNGDMDSCHVTILKWVSSAFRRALRLQEQILLFKNFRSSRERVQTQSQFAFSLPAPLTWHLPLNYGFCICEPAPYPATAAHSSSTFRSSALSSYCWS